MSAYELLYTKKALEDLKGLEKNVARRIVMKLGFFIEQKDPLSFAKRLKDPRYGEYRFRIGDYRVIFDVDSKGTLKILLILTVKHRKEVYRDL